MRHSTPSQRSSAITDTTAHATAKPMTVSRPRRSRFIASTISSALPRVAPGEGATPLGQFVVSLLGRLALLFLPAQLRRRVPSRARVGGLFMARTVNTSVERKACACTKQDHFSTGESAA